MKYKLSTLTAQVAVVINFHKKGKMMKFILFVSFCLFFVSPVYSKDSDILHRVFGQEIDQIDYESIDKTSAGLLRYKTKMNDVHKYVSQSDGNPLFTATITFKIPMTVIDIVDMIERYELMPSFVYVFAKDQQNNEIVTMGFKVSRLESFSEDFAEIIQSFEQETGFDVLGVTAILGYLPRQKIQISAKDDRIFLVDITADRKLSAKGQKHKHHFGWDLYHTQFR